MLTYVRVQTREEGPEGVKWESGLAGFCPGKMGLSHWDCDSVIGNWNKMSEFYQWELDMCIVK